MPTLGNSQKVGGKPLVGLFFYDLRRKRRGSSPRRAHHQHWNVHGLKKSPRTAETGEKTLSRFERWCSTLLLTIHKEEQKIEGLRQANSNSKRSDKSLQTTHSQIFFRNFSMSLTLLLSLYFLSPHPSPLLSQPVDGERKDFVCCDS